MIIRTFTNMRASDITDEALYQRRREFIKSGLLAAGTLASASVLAYTPRTLKARKPSPFDAKDELTTEKDVTTYNNYYEFGTSKDEPAQQAKNFEPLPWKLTIAGNAEKTGNFDLAAVLKGFTLEERIYRHRCVEAWSMVIPWLGIPLAGFLNQFKPLASAKYVAFTTLMDSKRMPGQNYDVLDWPYREGLRIDEATNPLAFLALGLYGKQLPAQNGAPLRLVTPWKYGFKGIKAIVKIEFTQTMPVTSWNQSAPDEYGFYANVNPAVDHPRWSQASERRLSGSGFSLFPKRVDTLPFNGYAEHVASMYQGMDLRKNY
jgi:methionine sulfoxide reductase catalytic subunit